MTEMRTYRLAGLEPDNLLAFLALLGLLRSLQAVHPEWHPRARWATEAQLLRPELAARAGNAGSGARGRCRGHRATCAGP